MLDKCPLDQLFNPNFCYSKLKTSDVNFNSKITKVYDSYYAEDYWLITGIEEIEYISKNIELFSSYENSSMLENYNENELRLLRLQLINMFGKEHAYYRDLISDCLKKVKLKVVDESIKEFIFNTLIAVSDYKTFNFVEEVSWHIPFISILILLGLPIEDRYLLIPILKDLLFSNSKYVKQNAASNLYKYIIEVITLEKYEQNGIVSHFEKNNIFEENLEVGINQIMFIIISGTSSTQAAISHTFRLFSENKLQFALLKKDPSLTKKAIEEVLRISSPFFCMRRTVIQDTSIQNTILKKGDKILLHYYLYNNNLENGEEFNIQNTFNNRAFGIGSHSCLGLNLAKLEIELFIKYFLLNIEDLYLDQNYIYDFSNQINSLKEMQVYIIKSVI